MGTTGALGMKESIDRGWVSKRDAMIWQLRSNFYPPLPLSMVDACLKAIEYGNQGKWETRVRLPEGILFKGKYKTAPVSEIIETHRLECFLDSDEDFYDEDEE